MSQDSATTAPEPPIAGQGTTSNGDGADASRTAGAEVGMDATSSVPLVSAIGIALVHLAVVAVEPTPAVAALVGLELAVGVGLAVVELHSGSRRSLARLVSVGGLFLGAVGLTWLALTVWSLPVATVASGVTLALVAYGLHRYQLVALELVGEDDEQ